MGRREEIDIEIAAKKSQIYRYECIVEELLQKIKKAESIEWDIRGYRTALNGSLERRTYVNKKIHNLDINENITTNYSQGLQKYLEGYDYIDADGGLVKLMTIICDKIDDFKRELYHTRQLIEDAYSCIGRLNWEKSTLLEEE